MGWIQSTKLPHLAYGSRKLAMGRMAAATASEAMAITGNADTTEVQPYRPNDMALHFKSSKQSSPEGTAV